MKRLLFAIPLFLSVLMYGQQSKSDTVLSYNNVTKGTDTIILVTIASTSTQVTMTTSKVIKPYIPGVVTPPPITDVAQFSMVSIAQTEPDWLSPLRGANWFYGGNGSEVPLPGTSSFGSLDNDYRFEWKDLQKDANTFTFDPLGNVIKQAIAKGQRLSFGVMSYDDSKQSSPSFLQPTAGQCPDWNSEAYLSAVEKFNKALYAYLVANNWVRVISHIDIRHMGNYGEWHMYGVKNFIKPTVATIKRLVDAYTKNIPDIPLISIISAYGNNSNIPQEGSAYLLSASNLWGAVGIRSDHLGDKGNFTFDTQNSYVSSTGVNFKNEINNRWMKAEILGELMNDLTKISTGGSSPYWDLSNEVKSLHVSQFSNANWARNGSSGASASQIASSDINIRAASKVSGYRIYLDDGLLQFSPGQLSVTLDWVNVGVAPVYENWDTYLELRQGTDVKYSIKSGFKLKGFLPGAKAIKEVFTNIAPGNYSIVWVTKDPTGYRKPFTYANPSQQADGSYLITSLITLQ